MIEKIYQEIKEIDKLDKCSISEAVCKFTEESGEWIREINKTTGRKIISESNEQLQANILEEAADTLQNFLLVCGRFDINASCDTFDNSKIFKGFIKGFICLSKIIF